MIIFGSFLALSMVLESLPPLRFKELRWTWKKVSNDLFYVSCAAALSGLVVPWIVFTAHSWMRGHFSGIQHVVGDVPFAVRIVAATVALDLGVFCSHLLFHRVRFLWSIHKVHHSSRRLDALATFRSHGLGQVLLKTVFPLSLVGLGFDLPEIMISGSIYACFAIFTHLNIKFPRTSLDPIFCTPRSHRRHHLSENSSQNFGTIFSFWDRLAGLQNLSEVSADAQFGVPGELTLYPESFLGHFVAPFRAVKTLNSLPPGATSTSTSDDPADAPTAEIMRHG